MGAQILVYSIMIPIVFETFSEIWLICLFQDNFDCKIKHKKLNSVTRSILLPLIWRSGYETDLLCV